MDFDHENNSQNIERSLTFEEIQKLDLKKPGDKPISVQNMKNTHSDPNRY